MECGLFSVGKRQHFASVFYVYSLHKYALKACPINRIRKSGRSAINILVFVVLRSFSAAIFATANNAILVYALFALLACVLRLRSLF